MAYVLRMLLATRTHHELEEEKMMVDPSLQNIAQVRPLVLCIL